jgi:hypothetical protein
MYQQKCHYFITKKKDLTCPNKLFWQHLLKQLQEWRTAGDQIILFMDHNKHTYDGPLSRALADTSGLGLCEAVLHHTGTQTGAAFFRGSKPINGLWVSSNINIANVCVTPFRYGVGDHCMFVLDVTLESLIGKKERKIVLPDLQRLNSKIPHCSATYTKALEDNIVWHCLIK